MTTQTPAGEPHGPEEAVPKLMARTSVRQYGTRALVILFVLNATDEFDRAVLAIALDDIRDHFGLSDGTVGLLPLAVIFITGLLALPAGNLADRWSRTRILAIGAMVWGSAGLLAAVSRSFVQLFMTRALLGVGQGTIGPTHLSLLSDYYPVSVRGRVFNYWRSANAFGQMIGALFGGAIVAWVGWRWGFAAAAIPGLVFGLLALTLREPKRGESELQTAIDENPLIAEFLREPPDKKGFFESLGTIFGTRTLRYLIVAWAAVGFTLFGAVYWLPTYFERQHEFSTAQAGAAFAALGLAGFVGTWLAGPFADRRVARGFGHLGRLGTGAVAVLLVTWVAAFASPWAPVSLALLVGGAFVAAIGAGGLIPIVAACSSPRIRSQSFAAFGLGLAVFGTATAPVIIGTLSDLLQNHASLDEGDSLRYGMMTATGVVTTIGVWLFYQASHSADDDARRTIAQFLAEHTQEQRQQADV